MVYIWYHMEWYHRIPYVPYIYKPRENINGTVHNAVEGGKGGGGKDDESLQGRRADTGREVTRSEESFHGKRV
jgi:hypothetical protein